MTSDKPRDKCGVLGLWNADAFNAAETVYIGLYGIQHRGQQSAGIAVNDSGKIIYHKETGLVAEVFNDIVLKHLGSGKAAIGHVGYQKASESVREHAQPLVLRYKKGQMALSFNGCLLNTDRLREEFEESGHILQSASDAEIIATLLSRERVRFHTLEESLVSVMKKIRGTYSIIIMTPNKIIAARDPYGVRPLCMGRLKNSIVFSSESSALDIIGAAFVRDVIPGEILVVNDDGVKSINTKINEKTYLCIFELVYLARTDSFIDGCSVYGSRFEAGRILARESPADADLVIGAPDSAIAAAIGFARESGITYGDGLIKNRYIGRTFIQPSQSLRELSVRLKLNAMRSQVENKRVVLVEDSIVRGTTTRHVVQMLKESGGAREVHMRVCSPPVKFPCEYGIDTPDANTLIANLMTADQIKKEIGADSIAFLSMDGLLKTPVGAKCGFCAACFDGRYPIDRERDEPAGSTDTDIGARHGGL